jgi:hypothetical protein
VTLGLGGIKEDDPDDPDEDMDIVDSRFEYGDSDDDDGFS